MKQLKKKIILIIAAILLLSGIEAVPVHAASATLTFSAKETNLALGDTLSVVLTVESDAIVGDVELFLSYDSELLEFETGGDKISGGDGLLKLSDLESGEENEIKKYAVSFNTIKVGGCDMGLSDRATVFDTNGTEMSVSSNRLSININPAGERSKNTNLKSLDISPGTLTPSFHKTTKEYRVTVKATTEKLFLAAVPEHEDAEVAVEGNENLQEGKNSVVIKVTSPSGNTKEYSILVTKPSIEDESAKATALPKAESDFGMSVEDNQIILFNSYRFHTMEAPTGEIPQGYRSAQVKLYDKEITGYISETAKDNEIILLYGKSSNGEEAGFYTFDTKEKGLQRFLPSPAPQAAEPDDQVLSSEEYNKKISSMTIIVGILSGICILLLFGTISLFIKLRINSEDD